MPLKPPGPEARLPVYEGHYHSREQTRRSSGLMPTKPVEAQPLYRGHGPAAPALGPPGDSSRSRLFLPKELPHLLAEAPECFPPASPHLLAREALTLPPRAGALGTIILRLRV